MFSRLSRLTLKSTTNPIPAPVQSPEMADANEIAPLI